MASVFECAENLLVILVRLLLKKQTYPIPFWELLNSAQAVSQQNLLSNSVLHLEYLRIIFYLEETQQIIFPQSMPCYLHLNLSIFHMWNRCSIFTLSHYTIQRINDIKWISLIYSPNPPKPKKVCCLDWDWFCFCCVVNIIAFSTAFSKICVSSPADSYPSQMVDWLQ